MRLPSPPRSTGEGRSDVQVGSTGPDAGQEGVDLPAEIIRVACQFLGRREHLAGGGSNLTGAMADVADVVGDHLGAARRLLDIAWRRFVAHEGFGRTSTATLVEGALTDRAYSLKAVPAL